MKVRELYAQLGYDLDAHGDLEFVVELKDTNGNIVRVDHMADRYVSRGDYILRMIERNNVIK